MQDQQPDLTRIKANVAKMLEQDAPEADIDAYIASEGVTLDQVREAQVREQIGSTRVYTGPLGNRNPVQEAGPARVSTDRDREYSQALAQAFANGGGQTELDAISSQYGYPAIEAEQVNRGLEARRRGEFVQFDVPTSGMQEVTPEQAAHGQDVAENGPQTSQLLGFQQGVANVVNHAAGKLESGLDMIGLADPINQLSEKLGMAPSVGAAVASQQGIDDTRGVEGGGIGRFFGEATALAPTLAIPGGAFVQGGAAASIMSDANNPVDFGRDVVLGGTLSAGASGILRGAGQIANPSLSPQLQTLFREGTRVTPGQMARATDTAAGRAAGWVEDIVAGVPGVGAPVAAAQRAGVADFARAPVNRALRALGERLPRNVEPGYNAIDFAQDRFRAAYRDVLPRLGGQLDNSFQSRVQTIQQRARVPQGSDAERNIEAATQELGNAFTGVGPNGVYNGRSLRDASERLGDLASAWRRSDDPYVRIAGDVADQYRRQLHSLARRQNPEFANRLRDIDRGYASLVRAERAALAGDGGIPTPRQYQQAVRQSDPSARRRQFAAGNALDQDLSNAGVAILANRAAQGGSRDINGLLTVAGSAAGATTGNPGMQAMGLLGLGTLGASTVTHNPLLLRGIQATMGRQTYLSPETARVLALLGRAAPAPTTVGSTALLGNFGE